MSLVRPTILAWSRNNDYDAQLDNFYLVAFAGELDLMFR
jgi:hypothetical protein